MNLIDKKIARRVIQGKSSKENARSVAEWFSVSIEGQQVLSEMIDKDACQLEDELLRENVISSLKSEMILNKINRSIRLKQLTRRSLQITAVLIPLTIFIGFGILLNSLIDIFGKSEYAEIYVPRGKSGTRVMFQDGSEVYLNADTWMRYPKKFGLQKRHVYLQGEAYFTISSNKNRPFFVHTDETYVEVLGTSFNVKAYGQDENIHVTLDEGKVSFHAPHTKYSIFPGQEFVYNKKSCESVVNRHPQSSVMSLWKEDIIYFQDTPLLEVLKILQRRYDVTFEVEDMQACSYSYTLTTRQSSVDDVLSELEKISPVRFSQVHGVFRVTLC